MVLSAVVENQTKSSVDGNSYTTGSVTPTNAALYVVFVVGRTGNVAHRVPTLTGTNGWNTTWTRVSAAQAIYSFSAINRCGTEVFWGIASSGTAGTLTFDYGAGTNYLSGTIHILRIDGGPNTTSPIGVTGSAHDDTGSATTVTATLTGTPAVTSIVVACASSDIGTGPLTPSSGYATLGTFQIPDTGCSQPEYDEAPSSTSVGATFAVADICAISAVEVLMASTVPTPIQRIGPDRRAGN